MKTKSILLSALFVVASAAAVVANDNEARRSETTANKVAVIPGKDAGIFKVIYAGEKSGRVKLTITDAAGKLVHEEYIKHNDGFIRPYNFSNLSEGEYLITVSDMEGKVIEKVVYEKPVGKGTSKSAQVVKLANAEAKYIVTIPQQESNNYTLKVFDSKDQLLLKKEIKTEGDYSALVNLEKAPSDGYTFELSDRNGMISRISKD
ncbi:MAG TPA: T9SS type A sorting domain-containing protein [Cyclobacteriaceae bacterium]|nr:T9SS type A sorting domain-containing protein [Cyclobacteriaceae bacterium]